MWSRNARPVATLTRPRPSSATFALKRVSLLLRVTSADLLKTHLDRMRVRAQPLHCCQPHACVAQHLEVAAVEAQHAGSLHECVNAKWGREPSRPGCRKRVVGARRVVTKRHRGIGSHEYRAGILDLCRNARRVCGDDKEMLGGEVVRQLNGLAE